MYAKNTTVWQHSPQGEVEVARVVGSHRPMTLRRQQALLFAAAPDMLAALQTIANIALMDKGHWAKTIEAEALAAIAKATEI